jgi:hypothetical protein
MKDERFILIAFLLVFCSIFTQAETVYFLVAHADPNSRTDSYVLPLTNYMDIAYAQDLIQNGPAPGRGSIIFANIACGPDNINRDFLSPTKHRWGWHVTEFLYFAKVAMELCDYNPTFLNDCSLKTICFWSYTVVDELGRDEWTAFCDYNINHDNQINLADFSILAAGWQEDNCTSPTWCNWADLNHDGIVDLADLELLVDVWFSPYAMCQP